MSRARAFTIVEIIVASIIIAMIAGTTTLVISRSLAAKDAATSRVEAFQRATTAAEFIARDLRSVARESDPARVRLAVGDSGAGASTLLMLASGSKRVRPISNQPEGPTHAVQFRLAPPPGAATSAAPEGSTLWRRVDPVPNEYLDAGGVASPLASGISSLFIEAGDGNSWSTTWDSDASGLPHAVRVVVSATAGTSPATQRTATARVVVALDRTPLPTGPLAVPAASTAGTTQPATQPTTQPPSGGTTITQPAPAGTAPGGGRGVQGGQQGPPGGGGQPGPGPGVPGQPGPGVPPPGGGSGGGAGGRP